MNIFVALSRRARQRANIRLIEDVRNTFSVPQVLLPRDPGQHHSDRRAIDQIQTTHLMMLR